MADRNIQRIILECSANINTTKITAYALKAFNDRLHAQTLFSKSINCKPGRKASILRSSWSSQSIFAYNDPSFSQELVSYFSSKAQSVLQSGSFGHQGDEPRFLYALNIDTSVNAPIMDWHRNYYRPYPAINTTTRELTVIEGVPYDTKSGLPHRFDFSRNYSKIIEKSLRAYRHRIELECKKQSNGTTFAQMTLSSDASSWGKLPEVVRKWPTACTPGGMLVAQGHTTSVKTREHQSGYFIYISKWLSYEQASYWLVSKIIPGITEAMALQN